MATFNQFWAQLPQRSRWGLAVGLVVVVLLTAALAFWALRSEQKVLFANLSPQDAATMTAELERMKVPYDLADEGNTILVDGDIVHNTRLKLIGKDLPLNGTVGLELFNNADIGMTEFAQKVNYQRAQQGELTRTILSIEEVQAARVHLALPEQGLFKKANSQPKASVTVTTKPGKKLRPAQVAGIQRLVAAAIPNIKAGDVTVLDQHGIVLSSSAAADGEEAEAAANPLDGKRGVEEYLNRKLVEVLDQTFGPGQSIASVDVVLNEDRMKTTTESVVPAGAAEQGVAPSGVVVREKQITRAGNSASQEAGGDVVHSEIDYQVGRRVEQVVHARGAISRINVAVVVKKPLDAAQIERIKEMVALAVGYNKARGDGVAVYSIDQFAQPQQAASAPAAIPAAAARSEAVPQPQATAAANEEPDVRTLGAALALLLIVAAGAMAFKNRSAQRRPGAPKRLTEDERRLLLTQVRAWIEARPVSTKMERQA
ncbi:MAG TPA: flagellar basal-body MS-ring/collar protein FliF [Paucimonas sp.]|nr:flagellar basal-body MS-ring/collar protein FliF [Paucimonas sp.]